MLSLALAACTEGPTEPSALEVRFQELLAAPAIEVSPERASAFNLALGLYSRSTVPGLRVHRTELSWAADWNAGLDSTHAAYGVPPEVNFDEEFVLRANGFGYVWYEIEKLVSVRDTTFIVLSYFEDCNVGLAGVGPNVAVRLFPLVEGPSRYAIARHITDCSTGRVRVEYPPS